MEQERTPKPILDQTVEDPFKRVQKAAADRRKRMAQIDLQNLTTDDPEEFLKDFKQTSGE